MMILKSIKPKYADKIFSGEKKVEFMRVIFARKDIDKIIVYSSHPVQKIIGFFRMESIIESTPTYLWDQFEAVAGISEQNLFKYFQGNENGFALKIGDIRKFRQEIDPWTIDPHFHPPQSFSYLNEGTLLYQALKEKVL